MTSTPDNASIRILQYPQNRGYTTARWWIFHENAWTEGSVREAVLQFGLLPVRLATYLDLVFSPDPWTPPLPLGGAK